MSQKSTNFMIFALVVVVVGAIGYGLATMPDERSPSEHLGDAVSQLDEGVDDAARELEKRTPFERAADEFEDATDGSPE